MSEETADKIYVAVQALAEEIGKVNQRVENIEKVLKDHIQEPDAHHPGFMTKKK